VLTWLSLFLLALQLAAPSPWGVRSSVHIVSRRAPAPGDTLAIVARWATPAPDGFGAIDSYRVRWDVQKTYGGASAPGYPVVRFVPAPRTLDSARVALPPLGDSVFVTVTITASRRGTLSLASFSAQRWAKRKDTPPPRVLDAKIDTVPRVR
jgi:hypothetical protein